MLHELAGTPGLVRLTPGPNPPPSAKRPGSQTVMVKTPPEGPGRNPPPNLERDASGEAPADFKGPLSHILTPASTGRD